MFVLFFVAPLPCLCVQYEFKVKGIRKMRTTLQVSTQGVRVSKRKRKRVRLRERESVCVKPVTCLC